MIETEDPGGGSIKSPQELKSEVSKLAEMITEEDKCKLETIGEAIKALQLLTEWTLKKMEKKPCGEQGIPEEFLCPVSKKVMVDPVSLENGHV